MKLILFFLAASTAFAQLIGGPTQARKVVNTTCTSGQVPSYDASGRLSGCTTSGGSVTAGTGITVVGSTVSVDSAITATRSTVTGGTDTFCAPTSASGTAFTCSPAGNPLPALTNGMRVLFRPDVACSGSPTLNVSTLGVKSLFAADGTTAATCAAGQSFLLTYNTTLASGAGAWVFPAAGSSTPSAGAGFWYPNGPMSHNAGNTTAAAGAAHRVHYIQITNAVSRTVASLTAMTAGSAAGSLAFVIFDSTCTTKIATSSTVTAPGAYTYNTFTFTPFTLEAGTYFLGWTSSNSADGFISVPASSFGGLANAGLTTANAVYFYGSTAASGTAPVVFGSTCGTRTLEASDGTGAAVVTIRGF